MAKNKKNGIKITNNGKGLKVYKVENVQQKEEAKKRREKTIQTFLIVLIIILAIAAIFSAINTFFPDLFGKFSLNGQLAARVNGVPITVAQMDQDYERLPMQYKYYITKEAYLKQLIDEVLLTQEATKQGFSVSEKEVDDSLNTFMKESNVTPEKLNDVLKQKNLNYEQLRLLVKNQLLIDKLLQKEVKDKVNVTDAQALQYYNDNPSTFKVPETVTARHILVGLVNRTQEQAKAKAQEIFTYLKNDKSNFCDLVTLYTDDSGSSEKCGEYTFPKGQMVPEFEKAAFEQGVGNISIINTTFGYHIIWTINLTPEKIMPFADVKGQIITVLQGQQEKMVYSDLVANLRAKAKIINYVEQQAQKELAKNATTQKQAAPGKGAAANTQVNVVVPAQKNVTNEINETQAAAEVSGAQVSGEHGRLGNETITGVAEVTQEQPVAQPTPTPQPLGFTECLKSQGAVLYGAYWDSSTKKQKELFGADAANVNYIECGIQGDYRAQADICQQAGIQAYPTWIIGNDKYMGIQEVAQLATLTGCKQ